MAKGVPYQAIEICHTHPVSDEKIEVLQEFGVRELYEIDAGWIMRQTGIPKDIKYRRLI